MYTKAIALAALASTVAAQTKNLTAVLESDPNLSNLTSYLGFYPSVVQSLMNITNVTLLAPTNDAFAKLTAELGGVLPNDTSLINAIFSYHILDGQYLSSNFSSTAKFIPSKLVDPTYTSLTGGQVVEGLASGKSVVFYSGLLQNSTVTQAVSLKPLSSCSH